MRIRLDFAYDGTDFHGWARQPHLRTVQGEVEKALRMILRINEAQGDDPLLLVVAGRTDTGVHARAQVCHIDIPEGILSRALGHMKSSPLEALAHRLRHVLPADITLLACSEAPKGFDARFSALERTYVFRIADTLSRPDPLLRHCVLPITKPLDLDTLNQCALLIPGLKDFGSFATPNPGGTTIREVKKAFWKRTPVEPRDNGDLALGSGLLEFTIVADAFAHNMVRSLVGAQVVVAQGKKSVEWFASKLASPSREGQTGPIDPRGLTLEHVAYPADNLLGSRAQAIRAKRTLE